MARKVMNLCFVYLSKFVTIGQNSASKAATSHLRQPVNIQPRKKVQFQISSAIHIPT